MIFSKFKESYLEGTIDVVAVKNLEGELISSPFYIRFTTSEPDDKDVIFSKPGQIIC
jgi:phosphatidate phosphatase PAH1